MKVVVSTFQMPLSCHCSALHLSLHPNWLSMLLTWLSCISDFFLILGNICFNGTGSWSHFLHYFWMTPNKFSSNCRRKLRLLFCDVLLFVCIPLSDLFGCLQKVNTRFPCILFMRVADPFDKKEHSILIKGYLLPSFLSSTIFST